MEPGPLGHRLCPSYHPCQWLSFLAIPEAPGRVCVPSKALLTPEAAANPLVTPSPHFILMGSWVWVA